MLQTITGIWRIRPLFVHRSSVVRPSFVRRSPVISGRCRVAEEGVDAVGGRLAVGEDSLAIVFRAGAGGVEVSAEAGIRGKAGGGPRSLSAALWIGG